MNSRLYQITCLSLLLLAVSVSTASDSHPNVVILLADDLGSKDIGCYGGPVKTPNLDGLAKDGIRFTDFYSGAPVCSPARATLLTGRHHVRTGVYTVIQDHWHDMHLLKRETTIAELLKDSGYQTAHFGKWHLGTPFRGRKKPWIDEHGFDYWFATDLNAAPSHRNPVNFWRNRKRVGQAEGYACQVVVDEAIGWLDRKQNDEPFFLNIWFHEPHAPLAAPPNLVKQYGKENDPAAIYSATIDNTDRAIGRLLKKLKDIGADENTIVIYTSDHGSYRAERNGELKGNKGSLFEGGIRVPGIIRWPKRIASNQIENTPVGAVDLFATIAGLCNIHLPDDLELDGTDFSKQLTGEVQKVKRTKPLSWHSPLSQPVAVIRDNQYSLVGFRSKEYPKDKEAVKAVMQKMEVILEQELGRKLSPQQLWHECYNRELKRQDWLKLRAKFVQLNTFQEAWTPLIKANSDGITRFELYDLSRDPSQRKNIAKQLPEVTRRLKEALLKVNSDVLRDGTIWGSKPADQKAVKIHRLESKKRSPFDAFAYVNRIPLKAEDGESQDELAGRIMGRLANQEGRVLVKLPPGMSSDAYEGFKLVLESGGVKTSSCISCHQLPEFGRVKSESATAVPSLRNQSWTMKRLRETLNNKAHRDYSFQKDELKQLHALLQNLSDVSDAKFRDLIIKAKVFEDAGEDK